MVWDYNVCGVKVGVKSPLKRPLCGPICRVIAGNEAMSLCGKKNFHLFESTIRPGFSFTTW